MIAPETFSELLADWPTLELSADLGVPYITARKMRERGSVSDEHWPALIEAARKRGFRLDNAILLELRARRREQTRSERTGAAA